MFSKIILLFQFAKVFLQMSAFLRAFALEFLYEITKNKKKNRNLMVGFRGLLSAFKTERIIF